MSLSRLSRIVDPPERPEETGSQKGWINVQERLGLVLPADYKAYIDCYGTGNLNNWIIPYNPFAENKNMNLFWVLDLHHQTTRQIQRGTNENWSIVDPFLLYPESGGLLPWGTTSSIETTLFWHVEGKPASWTTIVYNLLRGEYEVWKFGFVDFLHKLFSGRIKSLLLPRTEMVKDKLIKHHPGREIA